MIKKKVKKRKKKRKKKKKSNKEANPPPKSNNDFTNISENNEISKIEPSEKNLDLGSQTPIKKSKIYKKKMDKYFNLKINRLEFEDVKGLDKMSLFRIIWSYERDNGLIYFLFGCGKNDILTRMTLFLLTITLYLFVNVMIMDKNSGLNLYTQKNKEKIIFNALCSNMFYPLFTYLIIYTIKRKISVNEFFVNQKYQLYRILYLFELEKISKVQKDLGLHNIEAKISLRRNKAECRLWFLFWIGFFFLGFNFYFVSSFCGIYEHSVDCVIWNTVVSIIFSFIVSRVLFLISASIRYYSLREGKENERWFIISCILNPYYVSYCGSNLCCKQCLLCRLCCKKKE